MLNELRALGLHMSIDDFGTGYSSLSLPSYATDRRTQIDRSFLIDVATSSDSAAIVRAVSRWPTASTWRWWPKASKRAISSTSCASTAATPSRDSCSARRSPRLSSKRCSLRQPVVDGPRAARGPRCGPRNGAPRATAASSAHGADLRPGRARPESRPGRFRLALRGFANLVDASLAQGQTVVQKAFAAAEKDASSKPATPRRAIRELAPCPITFLQRPFLGRIGANRSHRRNRFQDVEPERRAQPMAKAESNKPMDLLIPDSERNPSIHAESWSPLQPIRNPVFASASARPVMR